MNVGAKKDSGFGSYFAWGEIKPKDYYSWDTYVWSKGNTQYLVKYSVADRKIQLVPSDDAARANWGGDWRMPTVEEYEELLDPVKCTWEWTTKDGVNGYKVTGKKTGKSIFMPIHRFPFLRGRVVTCQPGKPPNGNQLSREACQAMPPGWNLTEKQSNSRQAPSPTGAAAAAAAPPRSTTKNSYKNNPPSIR